MNQINYSDFFCLLEMIDGERSQLIMNVTSYKKILSTAFGIKDLNSITNVVPLINNVSITFEKSYPDDKVTIKAIRKPYTREKLDIELI